MLSTEHDGSDAAKVCSDASSVQRMNVVVTCSASEYIYNKYKDTKTCDVIEENTQDGIMKVAEPIGVIAGIVPTTNPTSTVIFKCLLALKTR